MKRKRRKKVWKCDINYQKNLVNLVVNYCKNFNDLRSFIKHKTRKLDAFGNDSRKALLYAIGNKLRFRAITKRALSLCLIAYLFLVPENIHLHCPTTFVSNCQESHFLADVE